MKKPIILLTFLALGFGVFAQESEERELPKFDKISLEGVNDIVISTGPQKVKVVSEKEPLNKVFTEVNGTELVCNTAPKVKGVTIFVTVPELTKVKLFGVGDIRSVDTIKTNTITVELEGAGDVDLTLSAVNTQASLHGVGDIRLKGVSNNASFFLEGSGDIDAKGLKTKNVAATVYGVGDISVCAYEELNATVEGSGDIDYYCNPEIVNKSVMGVGSISSKTGRQSESDTTKVKFKNFDLVIIDKEDELENEHDTLKIELEDEKHETHFAIKYGFNGYLNKNNSINLEPQDRLFELDYARSEVIGFHIIQDVDIIQDHFKLQTGAGLEINNYMFRHNTVMLGSKDSTYMVETAAINLQKSKLRTINLQVPLEIVWQIKDFHIGLGAVAGYNIGSMTKLKYNQNGRNRKDKERGNYNINPFSAAATVKLGTDGVALFGTYNLTPLFEKNKAPELYPFSIGLVFGGF